MQLEIERKFLVTSDEWRKNCQRVLFIQGYIQILPCAVRIRVEGESGYLTIKNQIKGTVRQEFEYAIPLEDAESMLDQLCQKPLIRKYRHTVLYEGLVWVVDEFLDDNSGLILAEVELDAEDQCIVLPPWVGKEVSNDPSYYNTSLIQHSFSQWKK